MGTKKAGLAPSKKRARPTHANPQRRNGNTSVERSYICPLCSGNLSATCKRSRRGELEWFLYCRSVSCGTRSDWIHRLAFAVGAPGDDHLKANPDRWLKKYRASSGKRPPDALPTLRDLKMFEGRVAADRTLRRYLRLERGWERSTWEWAEIGYAQPGEVSGVYGNFGAFTFPVYEDGELVNLIRRFWPGLPINRSGKAQKYVGLTGRGSQLYPEPPDSDRVCIVEGPPDALIMRQHGFTAVTSTAGAAWNEDWTRYVEDCLVPVLYDPEGLKRAQNLALILGRRASSWAVDLSLAGLGPKQDVTDFFVRGSTARELRQIIRSAQREAR